MLHTETTDQYSGKVLLAKVLIPQYDDVDIT
jgi:hypothetical protein